MRYVAGIQWSSVGYPRGGGGDFTCAGGIRKLRSCAWSPGRLTRLTDAARPSLGAGIMQYNAFPNLIRICEYTLYAIYSVHIWHSERTTKYRKLYSLMFKSPIGSKGQFIYFFVSHFRLFNTFYVVCVGRVHKFEAFPVGVLRIMYTLRVLTRIMIRLF